MELTTYFWSVLQQDRAAVVICNLQHEIIYMNPAAVQRYAKSGGAQLAAVCWIVTRRPPISALPKWWTGLRPVRSTIKFILFVMSRKIGMFIWWLCAMRLAV